MEKENVLEIEVKEVWDNKFAWRVTKNKLHELGIPIQRGVGNYTIINLNDDDDDNYDNDYIINTNNLINEQIKNKLENFVKQINEKYGTLKIWRAEKGSYYYFVDHELEINDKIDDRFKFDDEMYKNGNYFQTTEEAEEYAEYIKKCSLEWHESRENNE